MLRYIKINCMILIRMCFTLRSLRKKYKNTLQIKTVIQILSEFAPRLSKISQMILIHSVLYK